MNERQKKIVRGVKLKLVGIVLATIYMVLPIDPKLSQVLLFIIGGPIVLIYAARNKNANGYGIDQQRLPQFVEKHALLKLWLILYCATLLPYIIYQQFNVSGSVSAILYVISFMLLALPVELVSDYEKYKHAEN